MRIRRAVHVHPETYCATDPLDWRRVQLHTRRDQCEMTWCTFGDMTPEAQDRYIAEARLLRAEIRAADIAAEIPTHECGPYRDPATGEPEVEA